MAYQITLTDDEYAALNAVAEQRGASVDALVHEALAREYEATPRSEQPVASLAEVMYRAGHLRELPTGEADTDEEEAELEEIARRIGPEKPWLSEMVIEDRGLR